MLPNKRVSTREGVSDAAFKRHPSLGGRMAMLIVLPAIMAFIVGWYGLGVFKPWPSRLAAIPFWLGMTLLLWNLTYVLHATACRHFAISEPTKAHLGLCAVSALVGTFVFRPVASLYCHAYASVTGYERTRIMSPFPTSFENLLAWHLDYIPFFILWTSGMMRLAFIETRPAPSQEVTIKKDGFLEILDSLENGSLIAVRAEGHYVRILSTQGEFRKLYRFAAALQALAIRNGVQTHRSYWVNPRHIVRMEGCGSKTVVVLSSGVRLPVSLTYRDDVAMAYGRLTDQSARRAAA